MDALGWLMVASFAVGVLVGWSVNDHLYRQRWKLLSDVLRGRADGHR